MRFITPTVLFFLLTINSVAQQVDTLFSFNFTTGNQSHAALVFDSAGNLYGTAVFGGTIGDGVVFRLTPNGNGTWNENTCFNFGEFSGDAANPYAGLSIDTAGNLYGTTRNGGSVGGGSVFEMTPAPDGTCTETILHSFTGGNDGSLPLAPIILDSSGNLYGATQADGSKHGGTVFELSPPTSGSGPWKETILYNFNANGSTGYGPAGGMAFDASGNLYGTTRAGGFGAGGTVFQLIPGTPWNHVVLHNFGTPTTDGAGPQGTVAFDAAGNLYGTTSEFGLSPNGGTAWELSPVGHNWTYKVIYRFSAGSQPYAGLTPDVHGNVYGTTENANGRVFELSPTSGIWNFTSLANLARPGGSHSFANLVFGVDGNLYGTTSSAGAGNAGTVFTLAP